MGYDASRGDARLSKQILLDNMLLHRGQRTCDLNIRSFHTEPRTHEQAWDMVRPGATRLSLNNLLLRHNLPANAARDKAVYEANERFWAVRPLTKGTKREPSLPSHQKISRCRHRKPRLTRNRLGVESARVCACATATRAARDLKIPALLDGLPPSQRLKHASLNPHPRDDRVGVRRCDKSLSAPGSTAPGSSYHGPTGCSPPTGFSALSVECQTQSLPYPQPGLLWVSLRALHTKRHPQPGLLAESSFY